MNKLVRVPVPNHQPPVFQWVVTLVVTEGMPWPEEIRKHIIADRLMTAIPNANVHLRQIEMLTRPDD